MLGLKRRADAVLRRVSPAWKAKKKYEFELNYWKSELAHLRDWVGGERDWWGIRPPTSDQLVNVSPLWAVNAVMTMHLIRPSYSEELKLDRNHFSGQRVLEVGCGPLVPLLEFSSCERHGIDPLLSMYTDAGWPTYGYDAKLVSCRAESMPYPDAYFDSVISVNALDHVDDFERVASEMQRVVRPGGGIYFEVEYHAPTTAEPVMLDDKRIRSAFAKCEMRVVINRSGREMFEALVKRFDLLPNQFGRFAQQRFVTWHGTVS